MKPLSSYIFIVIVIFSLLFALFNADPVIIRPSSEPLPEFEGIQPPVRVTGSDHKMLGRTLFSSIKIFEYDKSGNRIPCGMVCAQFELYRFKTDSNELYYMIALGLDANYKPIFIPLKFYLYEYSKGVKSPNSPDYIYFYIADDSLVRRFYKGDISSLYHSYEGDSVGAFFKEEDNPYKWLAMRIVRKSEGYYMLQFYRNGDKNWYELNAWFTYNYGLSYMYGYVENTKNIDETNNCILT